MSTFLSVAAAVLAYMVLALLIGSKLPTNKVVTVVAFPAVLVWWFLCHLLGIVAYGILCLFRPTARS